MKTQSNLQLETIRVHEISPFQTSIERHQIDKISIHMIPGNISATIALGRKD